MLSLTKGHKTIYYVTQRTSGFLPSLANFHPASGTFLLEEAKPVLPSDFVI